MEKETGKRMRIRFNSNKDKLLQVIIYILKQSGLEKLTIYQIVKMIFYGDKYHLNNYGRPITGDIFIRMNNGPVPSICYNILKLDSFNLGEEFIKIIKQNLNISGRNVSLKKEYKFNKDFLSETDMECLKESIFFCKDKSFQELSDISHQELSWQEAKQNDEMSFILLLDESNEFKDEIIQDLEENSQQILF